VRALATVVQPFTTDSKIAKLCNRNTDIEAMPAAGYVLDSTVRSTDERSTGWRKIHGI
jgi:hypothetical protein